MDSLNMSQILPFITNSWPSCRQAGNEHQFESGSSNLSEREVRFFLVGGQREPAPSPFYTPLVSPRFALWILKLPSSPDSFDRKNWNTANSTTLVDICRCDLPINSTHSDIKKNIESEEQQDLITAD